MTGMDYVYLIVLAVAVIATIAEALSIRVPARVGKFRLIGFSLLALLALVFTLLYAQALQAQIIGYFITGMLLVFALWRKGLANWALVASLGSARLWTTLTSVEIAPEKEGTVLDAFVGAIRVTRLHFKQSPDTVAQFLRTRLDSKKVIQH